MILFPFHTSQIWNNWGSYYVWGGKNIILSSFVMLINPWFMPLLFVIAGISTKYALEKRTSKDYIKERIKKLLIPCISGVLLIVPIMTYFAEKFHNGYDGGYFNQYILFFTKKTDLSGFTGGFTPGHLWFLLYLFVISLIALIIVQLKKKYLEKLHFVSTNTFVLVVLFIVVWAMTYVLNVADKSFGKYFTLFMFGYYLLSREDIQDKLEKYRYWLLGICVIVDLFFVCRLEIYGLQNYLYEGMISFVGWTGILAILGIGKHSLDFSNSMTNYLSRASFPIYMFHLPWIIGIGYVVLRKMSFLSLQFVVIMISALFMTLLGYEIVRRIPIVRTLFGIKFDLKI